MVTWRLAGAGWQPVVTMSETTVYRGDSASSSIANATMAQRLRPVTAIVITESVYERRFNSAALFAEDDMVLLQYRTMSPGITPAHRLHLPT